MLFALSGMFTNSDGFEPTTTECMYRPHACPMSDRSYIQCFKGSFRKEIHRVEPRKAKQCWTRGTNRFGETPVLCVIMIYHSPTMTSAQRLHGQDRASFGAS